MKVSSPVTVWLLSGLFLLAARAAGQVPEVLAARESMLKADYSAAAQKLAAPVAAQDPDALMLQGILHALGAGAPYDHPLAVKYWTAAARAGQRDAARLMFPWLPNAHAREWWTTKNSSMPKPAIEAPAKLLLAERGGWLVDRDKARKWISREAEAGNPVGLFNAYHAATFGARDDEAAKVRVRRLLERAAEMKLPDAMRELSSELEQAFPLPLPISMGFEKNVTRAAALMKEAADLGDPHAQLLWAHWLDSKRAEVRDPVAAVEYYRRSSEQGNEYAAYFLNVAYTEGKGVAKDATKAADYLKLAADRGNGLAVFLYASRLFKGQGMKAEPAAAIRMLEESLVCDTVPNDDGLALVAYAYASGTGVEKNPERALWWGRWAAEEGSVYAMELVAKLTAVSGDPASATTGAR